MKKISEKELVNAKPDNISIICFHLSIEDLSFLTNRKYSVFVLLQFAIFIQKVDLFP